MKNILCEITAVRLNNEDYDQSVFNAIHVPKVCNLITAIRLDDYPFEVGGKDGYGQMPPTGKYKDKNGKTCNRFLYYVELKQIKLLQ